MEQKGDLVEDIKQRLSIEDVIADYVELKRSGRNLKALSPFSPEKTPSFMVSPEKQIWHDFSSGRGGDMFSFVMELEGLEFRGALELLARKAGLDISEYGRGGGGGAAQAKKRALSALEEATKFYQTQMLHNKTALDYVVQKRGFNKESITNFRVGYAPDKWTALSDYLKAKNFTEKEIVDAGLGNNRSGRMTDMFRGRMMVPLMDTQGQVIGFTARQLVTDPNGPKYINTPQTLLYDKSRHVYGFSQAKDAIRRAGYAVITEGNLDVVSSHQAGVRNVVATAGTAMTKQHLKTIGRMAGDIRLAFDADKAGIAATERAIELAQSEDIQLSVVSIPDGKDPDDLVREDLPKWQEVITQPEYAIDWLIARYKNELDVTSARGKREFTDVVLKVIKGLSDPVEKDHYLRVLASETEISLESVQLKMNSIESGAGPAKKRKVEARQAQPTQKNDNAVMEIKFLGLLLLYPTARRVVEASEAPITLSHHGRQVVYEYLRDNPQATINDLEPPQELKEVEDHVKLAAFTAEQHYQDFDSNERLREANDLAHKLIKTSKVIQKNRLITELKAAEDSGNTEQAALIIQKIDSINKGQ